MPNIEPETLLTEADAAAILHIARVTLARWRRQGIGPRHLRMGRAIRYRADDVRTFVTSKEVAS